MRILVVASYNKNQFAPFIMEQVAALKRAGIEIEMFGVKGKGIKGYFKSIPRLRDKIKEARPDLIHAHYGLCGLLANFQRAVPVVTTYHGSDINIKRIRRFSRISVLLSKHNIFVSNKSMSLINPVRNFSLIPCGIDLTEVQLTQKTEARERMKLDANKKYVLFASAFDNEVKNYPLAQESISLIPDAELLELKGYSREEVTLMMCASDCLLMTSHSEGSPQVIKEAMACGCPIVSVDVGDVKETIMHTEGCFISPRDADSLAMYIKKAIKFGAKTSGRKRILDYNNDVVAKKLISIYNRVISRL